MREEAFVGGQLQRRKANGEWSCSCARYAASLDNVHFETRPYDRCPHVRQLESRPGAGGLKQASPLCIICGLEVDGTYPAHTSGGKRYTICRAGCAKTAYERTEAHLSERRARRKEGKD